MSWPEPSADDSGSSRDSGLNPDVDNDGYTVADGDCDDNDPDEYPGVLWYPDGDGDGLGDADATPSDCMRAEASDVTNDDDCDDGDNARPASDDLDCDGVVASLDCDDTNASSTTVAIDRDCDAVVTAEDCDDGDEEIGAITEDADCDGAITTLDCDDGDALVGSIAEDADCDGLLTAADCDDEDSTATAIAEDADCDGTLTADDCDDADAAATIVSTDRDCDGVVTAADCDDGDASSTLVAEDGDCDGVLTAADCDDASSALLEQANDADCDGAVTSLDCDDNDPNLQSPVDDADCDGSLSGDDCDDNDATRFPGNWDAAGDTIDSNCDGLDATNLAVANVAFYGEGASDRSGISVASAGDVDGDGLSDILVGAAGNIDAGVGAGKAYLIFGKDVTPGIFNLSTASATFTAEFAGDQAGYAVASAGDVDNDGKADVLIGAPRANGAGTDRGRVYLFLGANLAGGGDFNLSQATTVFEGEADDHRAGFSLDSVGDIDNDNRDELLIGAEGWGKSYVVRGVDAMVGGVVSLANAHVVLEPVSGGEMTAYSVSSAGDVDNDGRSDVLIGAPFWGGAAYRSGRTFLMLGSTLASGGTFSLANADIILEGTVENSQSGFSVSGAGDVDGDMRDDILIGAYADLSGRTYLVLAASLPTSGTVTLDNADLLLQGEADGNSSGAAVCSAGDVDGDGLADLLIGDYLHAERGTHAGKAYMLLGASLGTGTVGLESADAEFVGESNIRYSGTSVSSAGDVNGDGLDDILIAGTGLSEGGTNAGKTYLLLSPFSAP